MVMDVEPSEDDIKKANNLAVLLIVGQVLTLMGVSLLVWVLYNGGALDSEGAFGGKTIIALWYILNLPLGVAAVFTFLRSGYKLVFIFLAMGLLFGLTSLGIGTIFSIICLIKLSKSKNAFPDQLERSIKRAEAKKKIDKDRKAVKLELECPQCEKDFAVKDNGKRPLAIKCPHCGVEGEI